MSLAFAVQATGSFTPALLAIGVIGLCSVMAYALAIPGEPIPNKALAGGLATWQPGDYEA